MALTFIEQAGGGAEPTFKCSNESIEAEALYRLADDAGAIITPDDLHTKVNELIGTCATSVGTGGLSRTIPKVHPIMREAYVGDVTIKGDGADWEVGEILSETATQGAPIPNYANYPAYMFTVKFHTRGSVKILRDNNPKLMPGRRSYFDYLGRKVVYKAVPEWERFTLLKSDAKFEVIEAQAQGAFKFWKDDGTLGAPFSSTPFMPLPDSKVSIDWFMVPYRYVLSANSYLVNCTGRINQTLFKGYQPGELMYLGCETTKIYSTPQFTPFDGDFELNQLCDVKLMFKRTTRVAQNATDPAKIANKNWLPLGHNLLPNFASRTFRYATIGKAALALRHPCWESFDVGVLFQDPDANIAVSVDGSPALTIPGY